jgi:hypothetical protein
VLGSNYSIIFRLFHYVQDPWGAIQNIRRILITFHMIAIDRAVITRWKIQFISGDRKFLKMGNVLPRYHAGFVAAGRPTHPSHSFRTYKAAKRAFPGLLRR